MPLPKRGKNISAVEVVGISANGLWLLVHDTEYFLPYRDFPWFRNATVSQIGNVRFLHGYHLYWVDLDVDLEVDSLGRLEKYPLVYR